MMKAKEKTMGRRLMMAGLVLAGGVLGGGIVRAEDPSLVVEEEPAIQAAPLAQAHIERSRELQAQGEIAAAAGELDKALSLSSRLPSAHFNRAELLRSQGDIEGALREYTRAIEALALDQYLR
jgi:Tfp pilus assembly protein PilF